MLDSKLLEGSRVVTVYNDKKIVAEVVKIYADGTVWCEWNGPKGLIGRSFKQSVLREFVEPKDHTLVEASDLFQHREDDERVMGEEYTFDKFMDRIILDENQTRRRDARDDELSPQRRLARMYRERPLNKTRIGGR